jgi:CTP:phosphocholine cytidylyltransferase-like protein
MPLRCFDHNHIDILLVFFYNKQYTYLRYYTHLHVFVLIKNSYIIGAHIYMRAHQILKEDVLNCRSAMHGLS